jgi:hypothetical protein
VPRSSPPCASFALGAERSSDSVDLKLYGLLGSAVQSFLTLVSSLIAKRSKCRDVCLFVAHLASAGVCPVTLWKAARHTCGAVGPGSARRTALRFFAPKERELANYKWSGSGERFSLTATDRGTRLDRTVRLHGRVSRES